MTGEPVTIAHPTHPLYALTSYELHRYRKDLEHAINGIAADAPAHADLRRQLDAVTAEQDDHARIAHA